MLTDSFHFNIAHEPTVLILDGSQVASMARVSLYQKTQIKKHIADRHYYLTQAKQSIKLNESSEVHFFCALAEKEQESLDVLAAWHGTHNIVR